MKKIEYKPGMNAIEYTAYCMYCFYMGQKLNSPL